MIRLETALFAAAQARDPVALKRMLREPQPDIRRYLLRDMEQFSIVEVAHRLRITRESCKSRIHRGRALLRDYLQGDESRGGRK